MTADLRTRIHSTCAAPCAGPAAVLAQPAVEVGLDRDTLGVHLRVGVQLERRIGGEHDSFEELVDVLAVAR